MDLINISFKNLAAKIINQAIIDKDYNFFYTDWCKNLVELARCNRFYSDFLKHKVAEFKIERHQDLKKCKSEYLSVNLAYDIFLTIKSKSLKTSQKVKLNTITYGTHVKINKILEICKKLKVKEIECEKIKNHFEYFVSKKDFEKIFKFIKNENLSTRI